MIKTHCDLCGEEVSRNYIADPFRIDFRTVIDGSNIHLTGTIKASMYAGGLLSEHLCKSCVLRAMHDGIEAAIGA